MPTDYPTGYDDFTNPQATDPQSNPSHSAQHRNANDALEAIEHELGLNPSGSEATVADRFAALGSGAFADLSDVDLTGVATGDVPVYDGALWVPGQRQPLDADLTAIAGLTPSNDDIIQRKAGAWVNRTLAQLLTDLNLGALYQPLDSDLTAIAALSTTSIGRSLLAGADAAALRAIIDSPSNAEAILDAIGDAKGDLIGFSAADTPGRLAVGSNDQVLTADSAQSLGIKWATPSAGGNFTLISDATPNAAIVDFTSIPSTYKHLLIYGQARGNAAVNSADILMRIGTGGGATDTGSNYDREYVAGVAAAASAGNNDGTTSISMGSVPGTSATASRSGAFILFIPNYASTSFHKGFWSLAGMHELVGPVKAVTIIYSQWRNTAAIDRVALHFNAIGTGFVNGTRFSLYGLS